jgi:hypothetical protein
MQRAAFGTLGSLQPFTAPFTKVGSGPKAAAHISQDDG